MRAWGRQRRGQSQESRANGARTTRDAEGKREGWESAVGEAGSQPLAGKLEMGSGRRQEREGRPLLQ